MEQVGFEQASFHLRWLDEKMKILAAVVGSNHPTQSTFSCDETTVLN